MKQTEATKHLIANRVRICVLCPQILGFEAKQTATGQREGWDGLHSQGWSSGVLGKGRNTQLFPLQSFTGGSVAIGQGRSGLGGGGSWCL